MAALFAENQLTPKYPLEIVALIEEEGARFGGGLMGSRGIVGTLSEESFKNSRDKDGITTIEAMSKIGLDFSLPKRRNSNSIKAFLELHIEQGPILEEKNIPIGVVEAIVGLTQFEVTIEGKAGHAGTTPMDRRTDALVAAAQIISQLPSFAIEEGEGTVITTGRLHVLPNGANVIPNKVVFSVDIRSSKEEHINNVIRRMKELIESYQEQGVHTAAEQLLYMPPKVLSNEIKALLKDKSSDLKIPYCSINSGAGHDAMVFSDVTDVGMLFVPNKAGLSHCPEEWSDARHLANGVQIFYEVAKCLTEVE